MSVNTGLKVHFLLKRLEHSSSHFTTVATSLSSANVQLCIRYTTINVCVAPYNATSLTLKMEIAASARHFFRHLPNYTASHPVRPYTCIYRCDIIEFITMYKLDFQMNQPTRCSNFSSLLFVV